MRLCGVTTRFHRVTKLVSGHTVSSWMGGKRNRVVEGKGRRRDGRRKKWRKEKLGRERERKREKREKFGEWRLASGKVELPFRLERKRYLVVSCSKIVEKDRKSSRAFDVQLLPMENAFSRYRAVHSDHETFMLARRWERGGRYRCSGEK